MSPGRRPILRAGTDWDKIKMPPSAAIIRPTITSIRPRSPTRYLWHIYQQKCKFGGKICTSSGYFSPGRIMPRRMTRWAERNTSRVGMAARVRAAMSTPLGALVCN